MSSPNIIFNMQYVVTEHYKGKVTDKMLQKNTTDMFNYYDRDEACDKTYYTKTKNEDGEQLHEVDIKAAFNYYNYRVGSTGGFDKDGIQDENKFKNGIKEYKPDVMYRMVFSFTDEFATTSDIKLKENMQKLITKSMEKNIRAMGFDPDNVEWTGFYHTNTGHPHVHVVMYEKERTRKKFAIPKDKFKRVKSNIVRAMNLNAEIYIDRDNSKKDIYEKLEKLGLNKNSKKLLIASENNSKFFLKKKDKELTKLLLELEKKIPKIGSLKFNSKNIRPYHEDINNIVDLLLNKEEVKGLNDRFNELLDKEVELQILQYGGKETDDDKLQFIDNKQQEVRDKIANMILGTIKNHRLDMDEEVEQEDVSTNGKDNKQVYKRNTFKKRRNMSTRANINRYGTGKELERAIMQAVNAIHMQEYELDLMRRNAEKENAAKLFASR